MTITAGTVTHLDSSIRFGDRTNLIEACIDTMDAIVKRNLTIDEINELAFILLDRLIDLRADLGLTDPDPYCHDEEDGCCDTCESNHYKIGQILRRIEKVEGKLETQKAMTVTQPTSPEST